MQLGQKIRFIPNGFSDAETRAPLPGTKAPPPRKVTGTVVVINRPHRHYTLEYKVHGYTLKETFKF